MRDFDWDFAAETHNPLRVEYLLESCEKPISEEQYANEMYVLARLAKARGLKASRTRGVGYFRRDYRNLVERFGFFGNGYSNA